MNGKWPLTGVKVMDLSWVVAGPLATSYLADYGATVVRIESAHAPDNLRTTLPYAGGVPNINRAGPYLICNNSKYGLALDLSKPRAIEVAKRLARWADVVVESFRPGVLDRLGLGYDDLAAIKPDTILVSSSIMGQTGPLSSFSGYGYNGMALCGITSLTGWPDRPPVGLPFAYGDNVATWFVALGILGALDYRNRTGKGQHIDVSQYETMMHFLAPSVIEYSVGGRNPTRTGNRSSASAPHGAFRCDGDDRWCAVAVTSDEEWAALCTVTEHGEWATDERFAHADLRQRHCEELERELEGWTSALSAEEVAARLQAGGVPAAVVKTSAELGEDPQLVHREYFRRVYHPEVGWHHIQSTPARLSESSPKCVPAPFIGEHTYCVCSEVLGMSDQEFTEFMSEGVFE